MTDYRCFILSCITPQLPLRRIFVLKLSRLWLSHSLPDAWLLLLLCLCVCCCRASTLREPRCSNGRPMRRPLICKPHSEEEYMKKGSGRSRSRNKPLHTTEDVINLPRGFWPHSRDLFGKFRLPRSDRSNAKAW